MDLKGAHLLTYSMVLYVYGKPRLLLPVHKYSSLHPTVYRAAAGPCAICTALAVY